MLKEFARSAHPPFRVWSAASSSGEEAYTIAMVLAEVLGSGEWEVVGTDISTRVLERARRGLYPLDRSASIPRSTSAATASRARTATRGCFSSAGSSGTARGSSR